METINRLSRVSNRKAPLLLHRKTVFQFSNPKTRVVRIYSKLPKPRTLINKGTFFRQIKPRKGQQVNLNLTRQLLTTRQCFRQILPRINNRQEDNNNRISRLVLQMLACTRTISSSVSKNWPKCHSLVKSRTCLRDLFLRHILRTL